eukprot:1926511-Rhodomonas_salina.6
MSGTDIVGQPTQYAMPGTDIPRGPTRLSLEEIGRLLPTVLRFCYAMPGTGIVLSFLPFFSLATTGNLVELLGVESVNQMDLEELFEEATLFQQGERYCPTHTPLCRPTHFLRRVRCTVLCVCVCVCIAGRCAAVCGTETGWSRKRPISSYGGPEPGKGPEEG